LSFLFTDFLPRCVGGATLLTTRSHITGSHVKKIEMKKMSQQEGVTFLLRRIASGEGENGKEDLLKSVSDNRAVSNCEGGSWTFAY